MKTETPNLYVVIIIKHTWCSAELLWPWAVYSAHAFRRLRHI